MGGQDVDVEDGSGGRRPESNVAIGDVRGGIVGSIIAGGNVIQQTVTHMFTGGAGERDRRDKLILLNKVREFWIKGVLEQSVHNATLIELGKLAEPDAVAGSPLEAMAMVEAPLPGVPGPGHASVSDIFEQTGRALLILGEPGAGKTITLLELARDRIALAEQNPIEPIPVIFNLSSWAVKAPPLSTWLVAELNAKYLIPTTIATEWIEHNDLLVLLDGLDEVARASQPACVEAINRFRDEHGLTGLAVCSRAADYDALAVRLKLHGAMRLQPLTLAQIDRYVTAAGPAVADLVVALRADPTLQELARAPLMLSIMCLAYQNVRAADLDDDTLRAPGARLRHLFSTYIDRVFKRRKGDQQHTQAQSLSWLQWLARNMATDSESVFLIEQLQPGWLTTGRQRWYYALGSRLAVAVVVSMVLLLTIVPAGFNLEQSSLIWGWLAVAYASAGLVMGLIDARRLGRWRRRDQASIGPRSGAGFDRRLLRNGIVGALLLVASWMAYVVVLGDIAPIGIVEFLIPGMILLMPLLVLPLVIRGRQGPGREIERVEALTWSWTRFARVMLLVGAVPATVTFLTTSLIRDTGASLHDANGRVIASLGGQESVVMQAAISPDGTRLAEVTNDRDVLLRDGKGALIARIGRHEWNSNPPPEFSADGQRLVTFDEGAGALWNATDGSPIATSPGRATFNATGTRLMVFGDGRSQRLRLLDGATGEPVPGFEACPDTYGSFSRDGERLLGNCENQSRLWDTRDGKPIATLAKSSELSPEGGRIVSSGPDGSLELRDARTAAVLAKLGRPSAEKGGWRFSADGARLVTVDEDGRTSVWKAENGTSVAVLDTHFESNRRLYLDQGGQRLLEREATAALVLWDVERATRLARLEPEWTGLVRFSPDGRFIVGTNDKAGVRVWDARDGSVAATLASGDVPNFARTLDSTDVYPPFDPTSKRLVTTELSGLARLWSVPDGTLVATLEPFDLFESRNSFGSLAAFFSPDGARVATVASDGLVRMRDAEKGVLLATVGRPQLFDSFDPASGTFTTSAVKRSVAFSRDGTRMVVAGGRPADLRMWSLAWLPISLVAALFLGVVRGVSDSKTRPNQGIVLTARNSLTVGVAIGLLAAVFGVIARVGFGWTKFELPAMLGMAASAGMLVALAYGGIDVVQHYVIRAVLHLSRAMPWNCARFLDSAVERVLLRRVGGGYIFIHRSLLEHFAEGSDSVPPARRDAAPVAASGPGGGAAAK